MPSPVAIGTLTASFASATVSPGNKPMLRPPSEATPSHARITPPRPPQSTTMPTFASAAPRRRPLEIRGAGDARRRPQPARDADARCRAQPAQRVDRRDTPARHGPFVHAPLVRREVEHARWRRAASLPGVQREPVFIVRLLFGHGTRLECREETPYDRIPNVVTIAGVDPSGGVGVLADVKTITRCAYACGHRR
jgi:hypothetical protein